MNTIYIACFIDGYEEISSMTFPEESNVLNYIARRITDSEMRLYNHVIKLNIDTGVSTFLEPTFKNGRLELFEV